MTASRILLALGALLLPAVAALAQSSDPGTSSQRDFILRHYFQGPSETSGWGSNAAKEAPRSGRMFGPFRPAYYDLDGERHRGDRTRAQLAALDLHVKPKRSLVRVAGQDVGLAKRFDGIPRWLWLEPGRHRLSFVTPEGETVTKTFELKAGSVTLLEARLD